MDPVDLLRPRRPITGMSAILLPFTGTGDVDWAGFEAHLTRTVDAGLVPAVNMDTGFVHLIDAATRTEVLRRTKAVTDTFVAGAFVSDEPGAALDVDAYLRAVDEIQAAGGTPIVFPSYGSAGREIELYRKVGEHSERFLGFELGDMFVPFGRILDLAEYREMLDIPSCAGAKHSSLSRTAEWDRLRLRDEVRPEFMVLTGNDLAIDMVMYGSDYLLGLSTFAPDAFAARDRMWRDGDPAFYELNDTLQYLGAFAFRDPVPAYRHDALLFLQLRGWLPDDDDIHPLAPRRPAADRDVLRAIAEHL